MRILSNRTTSLFGNIPYIFQKKVMKWEYRKNQKDTKFLIIDDKDGLLGLCALRKNIPVVIYEPNKIFVDGGKHQVPINIPNTENYIFINRTIYGFKDRVSNELLECKYKVITKSYYDVIDRNKYDYVTACRSLHLDTNDMYTIEQKINKIKSNVKDGGYIYLEYYIANTDDEEKYHSNKYLKYDEILKYFPDREWEILTNEVKIEKELITPYNICKNDIIVGYLDARKRTEIQIGAIKRKKSPKRVPKIIVDRNYVEHKVSHAYTINGVVR